MKKLYIVKHKYDFDRIIKHGKKKKNDIFIIYSEIPKSKAQTKCGLPLTAIATHSKGKGIPTDS